MVVQIAYLDCASGISGDMTLGALVDAGVELDLLNRAIASLGLDDCRLSAEEVRRGGFRATQVRVHATSDQHARHLPEILALTAQSTLSDSQKHRVEKIFRRLAEVEAHVHGIPIDKVHFHELGAVDTVVDIVCTIVGFELLGVERIVASPIPTGSGHIQIAHGRVSIPAPATAELLRGVPLAESRVEAELTTPTGAVLVTGLADQFGPLPAMTVEKIGCGAASRDLVEQPNLLRLLIGRATEPAATSDSTDDTDEVHLLETNLDDTTGEAIGYCVERLRQAGALDVWTTAIQMKKNRPGVLLSVLCRPEEVGPLETILFTETSTLGIRRQPLQRHVLQRRSHEVVTPWGPVQGKVRRLPDGRVDFAPEYESCRRIAQEQKIPLSEVHAAASRAFEGSGEKE